MTELQGENVIQSKGAIHYITDEEIQGAKALTEDKNILTSYPWWANQILPFFIGGVERFI